MNGKVSNLEQIISVNRYTLTDGKKCGLKVIDCHNGKIRFLLNESKCLDIMQVFYKGENISFISKNGFCSQNLPFINRFEGGMVYTCGLDNIGNHDGFMMHGTIHNVPAKITTCLCDEKGILIQAEMYDSELFGKNLILKRKIVSKFNSSEIELEDTLCNVGTKDEKYVLLYHVNLGYPFLDDGCKIIAEVDKCFATQTFANDNIDSKFLITDSFDNQPEMCYHLTLKKPNISVVNEKLERMFSLSFSKTSLPYLTEWKSMGSNDYALGLEPSTSPLLDELKYKVLKKGKKNTFKLSLKIEDLTSKS